MVAENDLIQLGQQIKRKLDLIKIKLDELFKKLWWINSTDFVISVHNITFDKGGNIKIEALSKSHYLSAFEKIATYIDKMITLKDAQTALDIGSILLNDIRYLTTRYETLIEVNRLVNELHSLLDEVKAPELQKEIARHEETLINAYKNEEYSLLNTYKERALQILQMKNELIALEDISGTDIKKLIIELETKQPSEKVEIDDTVKDKDKTKATYEAA